MPPMDGLEQQKSMLSQFGARCLKSWSQQDHAFPEGSSGGSFLVSSPAFCGFFCLQMQHSNFCLCPHVAFSLYICPSFPLLERISVIGLGSTLIQHDFILTSLCMQRPYFQIRLCSQVQDANSQRHWVPVGKTGCPVHSSFYRTRPSHSAPCLWVLTASVWEFHCYLCYPRFIQHSGHGTGPGVSIEQEQFGSLGGVFYIRK